MNIKVSGVTSGWPRAVRYLLQRSATDVCADILFMFLGQEKLLCRVGAGFAQGNHEEKI